MEELDLALETFAQESFQAICNRMLPEGEKNSTHKTIHVAVKIFTSYSPQPVEIKASFDAKLLFLKDKDGDTLLDALINSDDTF